MMANERAKRGEEEKERERRREGEGGRVGGGERVYKALSVQTGARHDPHRFGPV